MLLILLQLKSDHSHNVDRLHTIGIIINAKNNLVRWGGWNYLLQEIDNRKVKKQLIQCTKRIHSIIQKK